MNKLKFKNVSKTPSAQMKRIARDNMGRDTASCIAVVKKTYWGLNAIYLLDSYRRVLIKSHKLTKRMENTI